MSGLTEKYCAFPVSREDFTALRLLESMKNSRPSSESPQVSWWPVADNTLFFANHQISDSSQILFLNFYHGYIIIFILSCICDCVENVQNQIIRELSTLV